MEILWKGTISIKFRAIHPKLCENYTFQQNLKPRKLGKNTVFCAAFTTPIANATTTPILNTAATLKHDFGLYYDTKIYIQSSKDKLLRKIAALNQIYSTIFWIEKWYDAIESIKLKGNPADSNNEKEEVFLLNEKIMFRESAF